MQTDKPEDRQEIWDFMDKLHREMENKEATNPGERNRFLWLGYKK